MPFDYRKLAYLYFFGGLTSIIIMNLKKPVVLGYGFKRYNDHLV